MVVIPIESIRNPLEIAHESAFDSLIASIKKHGQLVPVHVSIDENGYLVTCGYAIHAVCKELGFKEIKCIIDI